MLKSMLVHKEFQTWHMIGLQHSHQPIRSHVIKPLLTNMEFHVNFTCGIFVGRYRPQIPRALGCQRGLALADLGCTVDHLGPTPANLIPPSSFAVSCDLKALWPGVLGCWGMGGRCTTWPINPPEVYTSFSPDPPGRQEAGCLCQSIGWRLCSQSLCADVGWSVCWHCLL